MAVASDICATAFLGNGSSSTPYPVAWPFLDPAHIKVMVRQGSESAWRRMGAWEYTVLLWENEEDETEWNPRVVTTDPYDDAWQLIVYRDTPAVQPTGFPLTGAFPATSAEQGLDRDMMCIQEVRRDAGLAGVQIPSWLWLNWADIIDKPFETVSHGGNGTSDSGKGVTFDAEGGLTLSAATLRRLKQTAFDASIFVGVDGTRSLANTDNGKVLYYTGSPAITLTIDSELPDAFSCKIVQEGSGQITIAVADLTLRHADGHSKSRTQWSSIYLSRRGANVLLEGDTAP